MLRTLRQIHRTHISKISWRFTSSSQYVNLENRDDGYSVLKMNRKPVNGMNLQFLTEMINAIDTVEKRKESRGLIITSDCKVFSAGIDLTELYQPQQDKLSTFWSTFQEMFVRLYSSPLITIAAINGAAPAGGCALSIACDYRIMVDGIITIGLNETQLGLAAPPWLCKLFELTVGYRQAEMLLCLGALLTPQEALEKGMIDKVVSADELMGASEFEMQRWLSVPEIGRVTTKNLIHREYIKDFQEKREQDVIDFAAVVNNPLLQKTLGFYFKALSKKKNK